MHELKLTKIGNSVGVILPKEILARLKAGAGDTLFVTETQGGISLSLFNADFAADMEAAREIMRKRRNVLRELAK